MESNCIIDVIIPVYNVESYVSECIDSILNQTFNNYRIILVDDGSTDNSGEICDKYSEQFEKITVIHQENQGLSGARNTGLNNSLSEYIMFIDSDDWIEYKTLEILYNAIIEEHSDIVCCKTIYEYGIIPTSVDLDFGKYCTYSYNQKEAFRELFSRRNVSVASWGKLFRRKIFEKIRFPYGEIHEDLAVIQDIILQANRITYVNASLWHYRQQLGSLSRSSYKSRNFILFENVKKLREWFEEV